MSATPNMTFAHSVSMNISYIQIANSKKIKKKSYLDLDIR